MRIERLEKLRLKARAVRASRLAPEWVMIVVKAALVVADVIIAAASFLLAFYLREGQPVFMRAAGERLGWSAEFRPYAALLLFVVITRLLSLIYYDLYRLRGEFSYADEWWRIFKAMLLSSQLIVVAAFVYRGGFEFRRFSYSRLVFALDLLLALGAFCVLRLTLRGVQIVLRRRGVNLIPTLVVGRGAEAAFFIKEMRKRPELGYSVIGVVENGLLDLDAPEVFEGVPVIGDLGGLREAVRESGANEVIITDIRFAGDGLFEVMMGVGRKQRVEFRIAPPLFNYLPRKTGIDQIGALPMIRLFREPLPKYARVIKRAMDLFVSLLALVLLAPVWPIIAALVKLDSRGPVLYKQERVGMDGRIFLCYKFRTMRFGADAALHRDSYRKNIAGHAEANAGHGQRPIYGKVRQDRRVTRAGRLLRRLSIDELPQLLNVLRGDMSVVGPRPPIPYEVEAYQLWHRKRLDMKPGLTGLWQVSGRNRLPFDEMVRLDLFYIENWSLLLDLKIILRTLPVMLRGDDAY